MAAHDAQAMTNHRHPVDAGRRRWIAFGGLACGLGWPQAGRARTAGTHWPAGPIRILLVYPPGGVSDGVLRLLADHLQTALAVPVRLAYRPGAGGSLGLEALAAARPDGHTLAFSALSPLTLYPQVAKVRYRPLHDIAPVAGVMLTPSLLVGTAAFAGTSVADLQAAACGAPGRLRWATTGAGTTGHLVLARWQHSAGCTVTHVPYKGGGQQLADALAGHFELLSTNVAVAQRQYIRSGRLKALAVGAPQRLASLPEVPTWAELGHPLANLASVFGLMAPAGCPPAVVRRLNALVNQALDAPALRDHLRAADNLPAGGSTEQLAQMIHAEHEQHRALLQRAPMRLE